MSSFAILGAAMVAAAAVSDRNNVHVAPDPDIEAIEIGLDTYVYGYPLVRMEMTRRVMTNVASANELRAPMGQFANMRTYPTPAYHDVAASNPDTLSSSAWLDISAEPYVLSIPDMKGRYYLVPIEDAWTNVFQSPGKRTTGTGPQTYAITGPGWSGELPAGVTRYKSPTNVVRVIGRIYASGTPSDYAEVHQLQDQLSLVPLSAYGKPYTPPPGAVDPSIDVKTAVSEQVDRADAVTFFAVMAEALKRNPPAASDGPIIERMARLGIVPGQDFDASKRPAGIGTGLKAAAKIGQVKLRVHAKDMGSHENGWLVPMETGEYGADYLQRATVAAFALGADRPHDSVHALGETDSDGHSLDGAHEYVIHFDAGQLPPVKAFWSLTMNDGKSLFVANPLNRDSLSARNKLTTNTDGSIDLYLQKDDPGGEKEANWLPAPAGKLIPILRLYWPDETAPSILDGTWRPPPIRRVD